MITVFSEDHRFQDGKFELQKGGDLWRLLAAITINKLLKTDFNHCHR